MSASVQPQLSQFALDVAQGLSRPGQKKIPPRYFYDDLGSALFESITQLPEYGLTRAEQRLLDLHGRQIAHETGWIQSVAELGSGTGQKTKSILKALGAETRGLLYQPIDVSTGALETCRRELGSICNVRPMVADWIEGLARLASSRTGNHPLLLLFLGSSIGNLERHEIPAFFQQLTAHLRPGDFFLLGADLVKDVRILLAAYDDPTGVTAAFNRNVLGRLNRELDADFDLRAFTHQVRWDTTERRIEMHLCSSRNQTAYVAACETRVRLQAGETIWTESSHKFSETELCSYAQSVGWKRVGLWVDSEWPFAEALWQIVEY
jgi:dimethylhistidine N-methyltransferase